MKKGVTLKDAVYRWVNEFNAIDQDMIRALMDYEPDKWQEITKTRVGNNVYMYELPDDVNDERREYMDSDHYGTIAARLGEGCYRVTFGKYDALACDDDFEVLRDGWLPIWGTMWSFGDWCDDYWLKEMGGLQIMSDLGFRIYEHEEWGMFFGIDGCGYDFYEAHWTPLYKARGLQWHDPELQKGE